MLQRPSEPVIAVSMAVLFVFWFQEVLGHWFGFLDVVRFGCGRCLGARSTYLKQIQRDRKHQLKSFLQANSKFFDSADNVIVKMRSNNDLAQSNAKSQRSQNDFRKNMDLSSSTLAPARSVSNSNTLDPAGSVSSSSVLGHARSVSMDPTRSGSSSTGAPLKTSLSSTALSSTSGCSWQASERTITVKHGRFKKSHTVELPSLDDDDYDGLSDLDSEFGQTKRAVTVYVNVDAQGLNEKLWYQVISFSVMLFLKPTEKCGLSDAQV